MTCIVAGITEDAVYVCSDLVVYNLTRINGELQLTSLDYSKKFTPFTTSWGTGFIALAGSFRGDSFRNILTKMKLSLEHKAEIGQHPLRTMNHLVAARCQAQRLVNNYSKQAYLCGFYDTHGPKLFLSDRVHDARLRCVDSGGIGTGYYHSTVQDFFTEGYHRDIPACQLESLLKETMGLACVESMINDPFPVEGMVLGRLSSEGYKLLEIQERISRI